MIEEPFKKPPPSGDFQPPAEAEALLVALHARLGRDRRRQRGRDRDQRPPLRRQHRRRPVPQPRPPEQSPEIPLPDQRRRTAEHPHHRLRQTGQRTGRPGPLRHDDPAAPRPRPEHDLADVDPPRPQGRNPRLRDRQVQRRLRLRRPEADAPGGQGNDRPADQPRRQRRLPRLRQGGRRDRLRLRRRRPPLLPLERRSAGLRRICRNQHPARLPAALREKGAPVRALPPHRHRPGPRRAPAGLPQRRPRAGPDRRPRPRQATN